MQGDFITKPLGWVISDEYELLSHSQKKVTRETKRWINLTKPLFHKILTIYLEIIHFSIKLFRSKEKEEGLILVQNGDGFQMITDMVEVLTLLCRSLTQRILTIFI